MDKETGDLFLGTLVRKRKYASYGAKLYGFRVEANTRLQTRINHVLARVGIVVQEL